MTVRAAAANGNLTAPGTWGAIDATSYLISEASNTTLTTAYVESAASTPGAITIDGIAVRLASRTNSPTGTMSVRLALGGVTVTGTEIIVNVSDVPLCSTGALNGSWFFVKFAAPVTLTGATAYTLSAKTSSSSQVNLYRDATAGNWSRCLRTATTGAPVAGDDIVITGEWTAAGTMTARTVTMDSTAATDYGNNTTVLSTPAVDICKGGTLTYGTTAATNYVMRVSGNLIVRRGGTLNIGTTGTPIPRNSTAVLEFDCGSDGAFGLNLNDGFVANIQGLSRTSGKNITKTKLTSDAAIAATTANISADTGWLSGDVVVFAPTNAGAGTSEKRALSGNAGASSFSITAGLTAAKSGTAPLIGSVGLLTRNVIVRATNASFRTYCLLGIGTLDCDWTEFYYLGTNTSGRQGIDIFSAAGSSVAFSYCSFHEFTSNGIVWESGFNVTGVTIEHCVLWQMDNMIVTQGTSDTTWKIDDNLCLGPNQSSTVNFLCALRDVGGTFTNNIMAGGNGSCGGCFLSETAQIGTFSGNEAYSTSNHGFEWNSQAFGIVSNCVSWHNKNAGFHYGDGVYFDTCNAWGNDSGGVTPTNWWCNTSGIVRTVWLNCSSAGTTGFTTANGIELEGASGFYYGRMMNCDFVGATAGVLTKSAYGIRCTSTTALPYFDADNCKVTGTSGVLNLFSAVTWDTVAQAYNDTNMAFPNSIPRVRCQRFDQTDGTHATFYPTGTVKTNSATYKTSAPSEEMQPASTTVKLESGKILVPANDGETKTVTINVRKNSSYTGNAPRLMMRRQNSMGISANTVCATFSAAADTWQTLTYVTATALEDGAFELFVDCDGTAGSVFVDDVAAA